MKNIKDKSKTLIYKSKGKSVLIEPIYNSHKICFDFEQRELESNNKPKINLIKNRNKNRMKNLNFNSKKFRTKTSSPKKDRNILNNIDLNNNLLEFSTEKGGTKEENFLSEFELLYNCIKKKKEIYTNKQRSKSGKKDKNTIINKNRKKHSFFLDKKILRQDSILGLIYENKKIKEKNAELSKQFDLIKKEFELIKKDNKDIKEELKEKSKHLKDIKLSMDIFSQELLKLQKIYKEEKSGSISYNSNNLSKNNTHYNTNANNSKKLLFEKEKHNNENIRINTNNINNMINILNKENKHFETAINSKNKKNSNKFEKIHQLPLNNINNIIKKQNKERGNSLETNNFQDTSKLINIETKDATEKENNENIIEKWSYALNLEKLKEKEKTMDINDTNNIEEKDSIDLSNISLADNLNINEEMYNIALNRNRKKIIGNLLDLKNDKIGKKINVDEKNKKIPKKLDLKNDNFNEEFMKYYDKFSDSWRKEVDKMLKKGI